MTIATYIVIFGQRNTSHQWPRHMSEPIAEKFSGTWPNFTLSHTRPATHWSTHRERIPLVRIPTSSLRVWNGHGTTSAHPGRLVAAFTTTLSACVLVTWPGNTCAEIATTSATISLPAEVANARAV